MQLAATDRTYPPPAPPSSNQALPPIMSKFTLKMLRGGTDGLVWSISKIKAVSKKSRGTQLEITVMRDLIGPPGFTAVVRHLSGKRRQNANTYLHSFAWEGVARQTTPSSDAAPLPSGPSCLWPLAGAAGRCSMWSPGLIFWFWDFRFVGGCSVLNPVPVRAPGRNLEC